MLRVITLVLSCFVLVACSLDLGVQTTTETTVYAQVVETSNQSFNPSGAAAGYLLGGKNRLAYGAIGGVATAEGCKVTVRSEGVDTRLSSSRSSCRELKAGDTVPVRKIAYKVVYKDGRESSSTSFRW